MIDKKIIYAIDLVLLLGSLVALFFIAGYAQPLVIAPIDEYSSDNGSVLFSFDNAERIYIDDNAEFSSPEIYDVDDNFVLRLEPGIYYWKAEGLVQSDVRTLTIESRIELRVRESDSGEGYEVVNAGNTVLNVDVYDKGSFSERIILAPYDSEVLRGDKFVGGEA